MKYTASYKKYRLRFRQPIGTSRGVYTEKINYYLFLGDDVHSGRGVGECNLLSGLSVDDVPEYETQLAACCRQINEGASPDACSVERFPSIAFALETALLDLHHGGEKILFPSAYTRGEEGIITNGLIWMGEEKKMQQRIDDKLARGFHTLKMKIGALNWPQERALLRRIRDRYDASTITLRVDANGAFRRADVFGVMDDLAALDVHSIEQPVEKGNHALMAEVIDKCEVPVALDEELIGICGKAQRKALLEQLNPAFLILKPSLLGGFKQCEEWIALAQAQNRQWWITSALESNIGLNAIAQWSYKILEDHDLTKKMLPQGLGLGDIYQNNLSAPLDLRGEKLYHHPEKSWDMTLINT
ncbi:MAG: o-succinylbenzoate synthase [Bacteroidetes bacterium]|nr:MAG: o-succinylbenzoate synthase [Bacteroidota bacterium]PIE88143.1 MAG: o-succinylbenzoate synthase [Bacteroidota bacterium]